MSFHFISCGFLQPGEPSLWYSDRILYA
uniref:Uncharacterized protein n=1 Tax=Rhizophora mucronata TaxID=61149 RepID=A0A2P2KHY4_RHIMU